MTSIDTLTRGLFKEKLSQAAEILGLNVTDFQLDTMIKYLELLIKWNKSFNLTAIRDPYEMLIKHLIDSLSIAPYIEGEAILDVGTGPGLPGIPLAILYPDKKFLLIDSNGKKTRFITQSKIMLGINNVDVLHSRVEKVHTTVKYDQILSRAFTSLTNMVELCKHLLSNNGSFLAMKGVEHKEEKASIPDGFHFEKSIKLAVPGCEEQRHLIIIGRSN